MKDTTCKETHRRTHFKKIEFFFIWTIMIGRRDFSKIAKTRTYLTWVEEWILRTEQTLGRTLSSIKILRTFSNWKKCHFPGHK